MPGRGADLLGRRPRWSPRTPGRGRLSAAASGVCSGSAGSLCVVALLRWLRRRAAIASGSVMPKSRRLTRICATVVMIEAPPGEPSARNGVPLRRTIVGAIDERGRLPPSTLFAPVLTPPGTAGSVLGRQVEVGELVVEQEAVARHDHAVAAGLLDGEGVVDDVAPPVGHRQVRRRADARRRRAGVGHCARVTGWDRRGRRRLGDLGPALRRELVGEQLRQRDAHVPRIRHERAAVGVGQPRGLEIEVQRALARHRPEVRIALEDVEDLADRRAAATTAAPCRRRRARGSRCASGRGRSPCRRARSLSSMTPGRAVRVEPGRSGGCLTVSTIACASGPEYRASGPLRRDERVGAREVGVPDDRPDVARRAVGVEVQRRRGREVGEDRLGLVGLVVEGLVDGEAVLRRGDARLQCAAQRPRPVLVAAPSARRAACRGRRRSCR